MTNKADSTKFNIPTATHLGYVYLNVRNLDNQIAFYTQVLGLKLHWRESAEAALGTEAEVLLRMSENPEGHRVERTTGLYHFALIYPSRKELARAVARLFALRYPNAPTDHGVSKSIYVDDPEGNTIELYVLTLDDAHLEIKNGQVVAYYADGRIGNGRDHLDLQALIRDRHEREPLDVPLSEGTRIGHVNLYASSLQPMKQFYRDVIGFQEGMNWEPIGTFDLGLSANYPHIVAVNIWKGIGIPPAPAGSLGLRYFTIVLPNAIELQRVIEHVRAGGVVAEETPEGILVRDPSQINVILTDHMLPIQAPQSLAFSDSQP